MVFSPGPKVYDKAWKIGNAYGLYEIPTKYVMFLLWGRG